MKVLFITCSVGSGGAERVLSILANYFSEVFEYDVTIATYDTQVEDFYKLNEKIKRVNFGVINGTNIVSKVLKRINRLKKIRGIVNNISPDIVISLIVNTNIEVALATLGCKPPLLVVEHSNYWAVKSIITRALRIMAYRTSNTAVVLTNKDKIKYNEYLQNCEVISNPILLEDNNTGLEKREKTLLCVGRLAKVKQFDHTIFVFSHIVKKHPDWKLVIVGNGPELNELIKYADKLGVKDKVSFTGNVVDMSSLYKKSGIFVLCSSYEGFPMALGEAMLLGMPVTSYNCITGPAEMIEDQVSGLLIEHNNKKDMENSILSLIENKDKRLLLGNSAKVRMDEFSIDKIGIKWKELIEKTVKQ